MKTLRRVLTALVVAATTNSATNFVAVDPIRAMVDRPVASVPPSDSRSAAGLNVDRRGRRRGSTR